MLVNIWAPILMCKNNYSSGVGNLSLPHDTLSNFGGYGDAHLGVREREIVGAVQSDILGMGDVQPLHPCTFYTIMLGCSPTW